MKNSNEIINLSNNDEVSSIIYALLSTYDKYSKIDYKQDFDPIKYVISSMYDLEFPVYGYLDFITRKGGARYIMNDVSSYRYAKGFKVNKIISLRRLFSKYGCKNKKDIIDFIMNICKNPDINAYHYDEIKRAIIAYNLYYKNNIIISSWPNENELYKDFVFKNSFPYDDGSFIDSLVEVIDKNDTIAYTCKHNRYPDSKLLLLAAGNEDVNEDSAAYDFYEEINEWFNKINPHDSNFKQLLYSFVTNINNKITKKTVDEGAFSSASASVIIITNTNTYILSVGNTRVYYFIDGKINKISRVETLLENNKRTSNIPLFSDYLSEFPSNVIGFNTAVNKEFKPDIAVIPTSSIDGLISITRNLYKDITDDELEVLWNTFDPADLLKMITYQSIPLKTNGLTLYKSKKH